jgi:ATP-dependent DNA ligase
MGSPKRGSVPAGQLSFHEPMECLLVSSLPEGPEWTYEIKLDGYRAQALCDGERTQLLSRNGKDLGLRFAVLLPELAKPFRRALSWTAN